MPETLTATELELRLADLFAATRDRALSVADLADHAFALGGWEPSCGQRMAVKRGALRLLRRVREMARRSEELITQAHANTRAAVGGGSSSSDEYQRQLHADPVFIESRRLRKEAEHVGVWWRIEDAGPKRFRVEADFWCTTMHDGRLWFHPPDVPVVVWAVLVQPAGVIWAEAEVTRITERNVCVRYAGVAVRLDRYRLRHVWVFYRGVMFVSSRTGRIAAELDALWQQRYGAAGGGVPPAMQLPLADAIALLGVPSDYTRADVAAGFRKAAMAAHPDAGGSAEMFRRAVEARDRLLAAIGRREVAPRMPAYAPSGAYLVYRTMRRSESARLSAGPARRRLT